MKVFIGDLLPGMRTGQDIYSSDNLLLLAAGTALTGQSIESLYKWGIPAVQINMGFLPATDFGSLIPARMQEKVMGELRDFFNRSRHFSHLRRIPDMEESVLMIVDHVLQNRHNQLNIAELRNYDDYLLSHSLGVSLLAVVTGVTLGWSRDKLVELGLAGLLHDVGKVKVPSAILLKAGSLNQDEWREVQKHPIYALDILDDEKCILDTASQHHETMDGSGYPYGLNADAIAEFPRIVAIADTFDAMTTDRVYRRAVPVNEVLEMIFASGGGKFDLSFVRAFVYSIAAYPVGSVVELSDRSVAVVSENIPGLPLYPRVVILQESDGSLSSTRKEIELAGQNMVIVRLLNAHESFALSLRLSQAGQREV